MQQRVCDRCGAPVGRERLRMTRIWKNGNSQIKQDGADLCPACTDMLSEFLSGKAVPAAKEAKNHEHDDL